MQQSLKFDVTVYERLVNNGGQHRVVVNEYRLYQKFIYYPKFRVVNEFLVIYLLSETPPN